VIRANETHMLTFIVIEDLPQTTAQTFISCAVLCVVLLGGRFWSFCVTSRSGRVGHERGCATISLARISEQPPPTPDHSAPRDGDEDNDETEDEMTTD
jgi:hypothetical protein